MVVCAFFLTYFSKYDLKENAILWHDEVTREKMSI